MFPVAWRVLVVFGALMISQVHAKRQAMFKCIAAWDDHQTECTKVAVMASIGLATLIPAIWLLFSMYQSSRFSPQFCILVLVTLQLLLLCFHYMFFRHEVVLLFAEHCFGALALCLVCFFISFLALRHLEVPYLLKWCAMPLLGAVAVMVFVLLLIGLSGSTHDLDCANEIWLVLSTANAFVSLLLVATGAVITRGGSTHKDFGSWTSKKGKLFWVLIIGNALSSLLSLIWDIQIHLDPDSEICADFVHGSGVGWLAAWSLHRILTNYIPIWGVLALILSLPKFATKSPSIRFPIVPFSLSPEPLLSQPSRDSVSLGSGFSPCTQSTAYSSNTNKRPFTDTSPYQKQQHQQSLPNSAYHVTRTISAVSATTPTCSAPPVLSLHPNTPTDTSTNATTKQL